MSRPATAHHGTYGYARTQRCRCELCLKAYRRYQKQLAVDQARGLSRRVDAGPVREHVKRLHDAGATFVMMQHATGEFVQSTQISRLMHGNRGREVKFLHQATAEDLLALTFDKVMAHEGKRPAVGIHRRIRALGYMGYSLMDMARALDCTDEAIAHYMRRDVALNSSIQRMHELYQQLAMVPGTNERARWTAYRNDHVPPMAWDDHTIDDPDTKPDKSAIVCVVTNCHRAVYRHSLCETHMRRVGERGGLDDAGRYRRVVLSLSRRPVHGGDNLEEMIADLKELGVSLDEASRRTGKSVDYLRKTWTKV